LPKGFCTTVFADNIGHVIGHQHRAIGANRRIVAKIVRCLGAADVTKLAPSRALKFPDGLRPTGGQTFVMAEGGGALDCLTFLEGLRLERMHGTKSNFTLVGTRADVTPAADGYPMHPAHCRNSSHTCSGTGQRRIQGD
jgi:hypothetical protein